MVISQIVVKIWQWYRASHNSTKSRFFLLYLIFYNLPLFPLFKVYEKVVKFSFTQQKIFWVLVFSICIWYLAYPTDRSLVEFECWIMFFVQTKCPQYIFTNYKYRIHIYKYFLTFVENTCTFIICQNISNLLKYPKILELRIRENMWWAAQIVKLLQDSTYI